MIPETWISACRTRRDGETTSPSHCVPWERDQAIDTAPNVHILVVAQEYNNGILVYHYDPNTQTLRQIWSKVIE